MPKAKDARADRALELYRQGLPLTRIAEELEVAAGTVRSWKNRYKWDGDTNATLQKVNATLQKEKKKEDDLPEEITEVLQNPDLTDKQRAFCLFYVRLFNATKAYQKAYGCDYATAAVNGSKLLRNAKIKNEIMGLKQSRLNREFFSEKSIFQKYLDIAYADMNDYAEFGRETVPVMGAFGPVMVIDEQTGEKRQLTKVINVVRMKESSETDGTLITEVKQGKDGTSIKLADRMKALDWLSKHMNMATDEQKARVELLKAQAARMNQDTGAEDDGVEVINDAPKETG